MFEKTTGIVLHTLKYGDDSLIVDVLTAERGMQPFLVRVPRTHRSNTKTQLLRPLSIIAFEMDYRPQRNMQKMREIHVDEPYTSIPYEPMKSVVALFLGEFLYYALRNEERNDRLYSFLVYSLHWFDMCDQQYANFHLAFLIKMTRYLGFWPNCEGRDRFSFFDLLEGTFTPFRPQHGQCLNAEEAEWIPRFLKMNYSTMKFFKMNRNQRNYVLDVLCRYYQLHIPEFPAVKSLEILRDTLS